MRRFQFVPVEQNLYSEELGHYRTFGLRVLTEDCKEVPGTLVADISTDQSFVTALARMYTVHQLHPCHLQDAVQDALAEA